MTVTSRPVSLYNKGIHPSGENAHDRTINFSDPVEKAAHDKMVGLVEQMLELHRR